MLSHFIIMWALDNCSRCRGPGSSSFSIVTVSNLWLKIAWLGPSNNLQLISARAYSLKWAFAYYLMVESKITHCCSRRLRIGSYRSCVQYYSMFPFQLFLQADTDHVYHITVWFLFRYSTLVTLHKTDLKILYFCFVNFGAGMAKMGLEKFISLHLLKGIHFLYFKSEKDFPHISYSAAELFVIK